MRTASLWLLALAVALGGTARSSSAAALAADTDLNGTWSLKILWFGSDEFALVKTSTEGDKFTAEIKDVQPQILPQAKITKAERKGDSVTIVFDSQAGESTFQGTLAKAGPDAGKVLGTFQFRATYYPASLEKSDAAKVANLTGSMLPRKVMAIQQGGDPKSRIPKLKALLDEVPHHPSNRLVYSALLKAEADLGQGDEFRTLAEKWAAESKPYGDAWLANVWGTILRTAASSRALDKVTLELATEAEKAVGEEAPAQQRADIEYELADAAEAAGKLEIARTAEKKAEALDEDYHAKIPPFKPEKFAGRKDPKEDRVVLMEIFTGSECPPCVAADVAFDGLQQTYKPAELVALQYHLHIPRPDPLTNSDTNARAEYYGVQSTPTTLFNGEARAQGGGPVNASKSKYDQYREIIDGELAGQKKASIELDARRSGDEIRIKASAKAQAAAEPAKDEAKKDGAKKDNGEKSPKPKLRLVLVEEMVRFPGGNGLRFHHHVVRALPGGAEGKDLANGQCETEQTVKVSDVRKEIERYLSDFQKTGAFQNPPPRIKLRNLVVVALVQDDTDKAVWHAVSVPVGEEK